MSTEELLLIAGAVLTVVVVALVVLWLVVRGRRRKRRQRLRARYGREYDATVEDKGRRRGVDDLDHREDERRSLRLVEPPDGVREDVRERMAALQFRFVEQPGEVLLETQRIVVDALRARGYPIAEDRERTLRLVSVDLPDQTPALRELLAGSYGRDVGRMRELFLATREAVRDLLEVSYTERDIEDSSVTGRPEEPPPGPAGAPADERARTAPPPPREPAT